MNAANDASNREFDSDAIKFPTYVLLVQKSVPSLLGRSAIFLCVLGHLYFFYKMPIQTFCPFPFKGSVKIS